MKILCCVVLLVAAAAHPAEAPEPTELVANRFAMAYNAWVGAPNPIPTERQVDAGSLHRWQEVRRSFQELDRRIKKLGW